MGLSQKIKFQYSNRNEIENFINNTFKTYGINKNNEIFRITPVEDENFIIELAIESYGLYIHKAGNYYEVFGLLIEQATGEFGTLTIEDY